MVFKVVTSMYGLISSRVVQTTREFTSMISPLFADFHTKYDFQRNRKGEKKYLTV